MRVLFASFALATAFLPWFEKRNCLLGGVRDLPCSVWIDNWDTF